MCQSSEPGRFSVVTYSVHHNRGHFWCSQNLFEARFRKGNRGTLSTHSKYKKRQLTRSKVARGRERPSDALQTETRRARTKIALNSTLSRAPRRKRGFRRRKMDHDHNWS